MKAPMYINRNIESIRYQNICQKKHSLEMERIRNRKSSYVLDNDISKNHIKNCLKAQRFSLNSK